MASHLGDPFGQFVPRNLFSGNSGDKTIDGEGIEYWYAFAQNLKSGVAGLVAEQDETYKIAVERKAIDAGLRAVIRVALAEIRKINPKHPLLDKKNRDRIFKEFEQQEMEKILKATGRKKWTPPVLAEDRHSSE